MFKKLFQLYCAFQGFVFTDNALRIFKRIKHFEHDGR